MRTRVAFTANRPALALALLSGSYTAPEDFEREGFVAAVQARGIEAQVVMAEVRASDVADGSVLRSIGEDVIEPARARGARRIWLAGVSLGALAALGYAWRHAAELERIALLSPYPGTRELLGEIDAAGGLERWRPAFGDDDVERAAWSWLRDHGRDARPAVDCYFASGDRFADGQRRMARRLRNESVREVAGGHEWKDWHAMWIDYLERTAP